LKNRKTKFSSANLRKISAAIVTLAGLSFTNSSHADFDFNIEGFSRTLPLAGFAEVQLGYDSLLWGSAGAAEVLYGYLRPYVELDTGGTYNSGLVGVEVFPISFLGIKAGQEWIQNDTKSISFHCSKYSCAGTSTRAFVESSLSVGFSGWFLLAGGRWEKWHEKTTSNGDFLDLSSGLAATSTGDSQLVLHGVTGFQTSAEWSVIADMHFYKMVTHAGISRFFFLGPRWKQDTVTVAFGPTYYSSTEQDGGFGGFIWLTWTPYPSLALQ
jgi:hypothetical protein